jgi:hypothetical protein
VPAGFPTVAPPRLAVDWGGVVLDLLLPKTDRIVGIQWAIMGPIWLLAIGFSWQLDRDVRHFVWGLCMINFAWFMARMIH